MRGTVTWVRIVDCEPAPACVSVNEADVDKWRVSPRETRAQAIFRARCNSRSGPPCRERSSGSITRMWGEGGRERRTTTTSTTAATAVAAAATLLHGWLSQKAAPLVVRVIDDRENMRACKKGPPSRPPRSYAESCQEDETRVPRECQTGCSGSRRGLPEHALLRLYKDHLVNLR